MRGPLVVYTSSISRTMYIHNEIVGYTAFDMTETLEEDIRLRTYDLPPLFLFLGLCDSVSLFSPLFRPLSALISFIQFNNKQHRHNYYLVRMYHLPTLT